MLLAVPLRASHAQEAAAERIVVSADRLPDAQSAAPFTVELIDAEELRRAPQLRLDDILRAQVPGFSLFRRSSSRTANPTTQGVTLRNFGPSGAGRTLVLLDGIPLNDPFAGYVLWSQVPPASLESVLVNPGGGAGLFGNAALAGTIFLVPRRIEATSLDASSSVGTHDTFAGSASGAIVDAPLAVRLFAEGFSTGGYPVVRAEQRRAVDTNAASDSALLDLRSEWQIAPDTSLRVQGRQFFDERENGTRFTRNDTAGTDLNAVLAHEFRDASARLQVSGYAQRRKFRSTFSAVNAARGVETPALDQFDVPATAAGGSVVWSQLVAADHRLVLGADARWVEGETNEAFFWNGTQFTRLRSAGGEQVFAGVFAEDTWLPSETTTVVAAVRYDRWELFDGFRRETERGSGTVRLDSRFADRAGDEWNARLGSRFQLHRTLALRGAVYTGFRVPTLNELYRPFRVGNDVTEANAALRPEQLVGGEAAIEWQPTAGVELSVTPFLNRITDAVGNITVAVGPGTFEPGGFIPAGGVLRQRQNIDVVLAPGVEARARWRLVPAVSLQAGYVFTQPRIEEAADAGLEGKLLAQTPEHVMTAAIEWTPASKWHLTAQLRHSGRQFEDDQNSRTLAAFTTIDAAAIYDFADRASAALRVENLLDTENETGRSAAGLVSVGAPRQVSFELRWQL
jgi:outer membrane receptor protein involved in Fe transport